MEFKEKIKKRTDALSVESKITIVASLVAIFGCFLTWKTGGADSSVKLDTFFDTRVEIVRYSIILFSVVAMVLAFFPSMLKKRVSFGNYGVIFFLGIESFLFAVIAMSFLLHASSDPTLIGTENIAMGLLLTIGGSIFMALSGFMGMQRANYVVKPKDNQEFIKFPDKDEDRGGEYEHRDDTESDDEDDDNDDQQQSFI